MTYDIETFVSDLQSFLNSNFNTKLAAIDSEKNDGITLDTVSSSAYFIQTMDSRASNYSPFIYIGIEDVKSESIGPGLGKDYSIIIAIVAQDMASDDYMWKRMYRYQRALEELLNANYADVASIGYKIKISSLVPMPFKLMDATNWSRAIGCSMEVSFA